MNLLAIDIESCTGGDKDGSLCSLGYCVLNENQKITKQEDLLVNPVPKVFTVIKYSRKIKFAYKESEFRISPKFPYIYEKIKNYYENNLVIGFAMANDIKYLNNACEIYGLDTIKYRFLDVQFLYKLLYPEFVEPGLSTLAEKYGFEYVEHRSDEDARVAALVLNRLLSDNNTDLAEIINRFGVELGLNDNDGYYMCFSVAQLEEKYNLKRSRRLNSVLFRNYLENVKINPANFRKTEILNMEICFSALLENNVDYSRRLIKRIYDLKGKYSGINTADIFVLSGDPEKDKRLATASERIKSGEKVKILSLEKFISIIGQPDEIKFDNVKFLTAYLKQKHKDGVN